MLASTRSRRTPESRARPCTSRTPQAETPARNASAGVICSPGPPRWVGSSITSWWLRTWLIARPGVALLADTTRLITRSSAGIRASLHTEGTLGVHTRKESLEVNHHALVGAASNQLDVVEGRDREGDAAPVDRDHPRGNPNLHAHGCGLEMLDAEASANGGLAGFELFGNRPNPRRLEPVTEDRRGQNRHAGILEPVGTVFGPDDLLDDAFLAHTDRSHRCHFTG